MRTRRICVSLKENAGCARFAVAACPLVAPLCRPSLRPGAACFQGVLRPRREALGSEGLCCWTDPVAMEQRDRERPEVGLRKLNNAQLPESATTLSNSIRRVLDECRGRDWFQGCTVSVNSRAATEVNNHEARTVCATPDTGIRADMQHTNYELRCNVAYNKHMHMHLHSIHPYGWSWSRLVECLLSALALSLSLG